MIRLAAIADTHCSDTACGAFSPSWRELNEKADVFLIAGDLTTVGTLQEAEALAHELRVVTIPVVTVMGNHDYQSDNHEGVRKVLEDAGIHVLEGETFRLDINGETLGIAGIKGFGGGFAGACGTEFGEPEMKQYVRHTGVLAGRLKQAMHTLDTDFRVVLMHYSPIDTTLRGEPLPIYPFMGSYLFAEVCDEVGADLILHGHAHHGSEKGVTPGGIPVRNVAMPLVRQPYVLFHMDHTEGYLPFARNIEEQTAP